MKLSDLPEAIRLAKSYRNVQEAIEIGAGYQLTVEHTQLSINVSPNAALTILNNRLTAISGLLNDLGVDTSV